MLGGSTYYIDIYIYMETWFGGKNSQMVVVVVQNN